MQRLAFFFLAPVLVATLGTTGAVPTRPADGTYVYAITGTPALTSSTIVIRTDGATVSALESVTAAGVPVASKTDYDTSTLLPTHYHVAAHGTTSDLSFDGATATLLAPPMAFHANPGTDVLAVGDGLIAYVAMLPSVLAAHGGGPISLLGINGGQVVTIESIPATATLPAGVLPTDIASAVKETVSGLRFDFWTDPQTHAVDAVNVAGFAIRLATRTPTKS